MNSTYRISFNCHIKEIIITSSIDILYSKERFYIKNSDTYAKENCR